MKFKYLFAVFIAFIGIIFSTQTVKAEGLGGINTGDYVYEDREYVTNEQYDRLAQINDNVDSGKSPQKLYILIFNNSKDVSTFIKEAHADVHSKHMNSAIIRYDGAGSTLYGYDNYHNMLIKDSSMDLENNYLILDLKDNKVFLAPNMQNTLYLSDLMFWKLKRGLSAKLKSGDVDTQVAALFQLADRLEPKLKKASETSKMLKSTSSADIKHTLGSIFSIIGLIILALIIWLVMHYINKHPGSGGGSDLGNSDYDAGFDEGYYMGKNDPF